MLAACGYKTKKDLKLAVGQQLSVVETSMFGDEFKPDGVNVVVGPSAQKRSWYAQVECRDGKIVKVS